MGIATTGNRRRRWTAMPMALTALLPHSTITVNMYLCIYVCVCVRNVVTKNFAVRTAVGSHCCSSASILNFLNCSCCFFALSTLYSGYLLHSIICGLLLSLTMSGAFLVILLLLLLLLPPSLFAGTLMNGKSEWRHFSKNQQCQYPPAEEEVHTCSDDLECCWWRQWWLLLLFLMILLEKKNNVSIVWGKVF